ncbi:hypothetical protein D1006_08265 [Burkholderia stabilis]|uniref:Uncharacterized protein n=1 Tax=Burkholderia stabilis TaxID=95485 RepID=A0A4Q2APH2_9BURK|nr:hypothetical protein D1006_08265 [Burkholderia stabilis]
MRNKLPLRRACRLRRFERQDPCKPRGCAAFFVARAGPCGWSTDDDARVKKAWRKTVHSPCGMAASPISANPDDCTAPTARQCCAMCIRVGAGDHPRGVPRRPGAAGRSADLFAGACATLPGASPDFVRKGT